MKRLIYHPRMPLDNVARGYANKLFLESQESIQKSQREELVRVRQDYAARGMITSGPYFNAQAQVLIRQAELLTEAKVDSLLSAYEKSGAILDEAVVQEITAEAKQSCEQFGQNAVHLLETEIGKTFGNQAPQNFSAAIGGQVTTAVTGIIARTSRRLSIMRDEATLGERKQTGSQDKEQPGVPTIPAAAPTNPKYPKPHLYYWKLCERFGEECYRTWRGELLASVVVVGFTYSITKGDDPLAWRNFKVAIISTAFTWAAFAVFHLLRTPWLVHRHTISAEEPTDQRLFGAFGIAMILGLCAGICYATLYFVMRPTPLVVRLSPPTSPQIASLPQPVFERSPRPRVVDRNGLVNGRVYYQDEAGNLNFPDPLSIKNFGDLTTQQISVHVYFSEVVALTVRPFWESTGTADKKFPFELWVSGPIQINPSETWKIPTLQGKRANIGWEDPIVVKMDVFYGASKPEEAVFRIEKRKTQQ